MVEAGSSVQAARRHSVAFGMQKSGSSERTKARAVATVKKREKGRKRGRRKEMERKNEKKKKKKIRKGARIEIARDRQRAFGQRAFPRKNPMVESRN